MYKFVEDKNGDHSCTHCCCDDGKYCNSDKCNVAQEVTGKYCNTDNGYFIETEIEDET